MKPQRNAQNCREVQKKYSRASLYQTLLFWISRYLELKSLSIGYIFPVIYYQSSRTPAILNYFSFP